MSVLTRMFEILQGVVAVLAFIVMVVEAVYEGITKAGEQKKKDALARWNEVKPVIVAVAKEVFGESAANWVDKWLNDKVVGIIIDVLVWWFNARGLFKKSA